MSEFVETAPSLNDGLAYEAVPDLSGLAETPGGAIPKGWYKATVIEGFSTRKGKQIVTADTVSSKGDSRNLLLAVSVACKPEPKNLMVRVNYRPNDLDPTRIAYVKELREEMKGVKGKWTDGDGQRSSLALAQLGQLQNAADQTLQKGPNGLNVSGFIGKQFEVRVTINEEGFNEINAFAKAGTYTR